MKKIIFLTILLATILVAIWFRDGEIMGTAEDSLVFYDITHFLPESQFAWMEHPGLGRVTINLTAGRPSYEILAFLQRLGIPNFLIQASTLWFILISAGLGVYLMVREFFPKLPNKFAFLSILFYWFNPLSLINVWNRFLTDYIFSFGLLPVVAFLFIKGLRTGNYIWSLILVLILPFYSFAFTYIAFDILLWIFLFFLTFLFFISNRELKLRLFYIKFFSLTFILFLLTNFWWIGQLLSLDLFKNTKSSVLNFDIKGNLGTLDHLSKRLGNLSDIFRLINSSFLGEKSLSWVKVYHSLPFIIVQYFFTGVIFYAIIKNIKNKSILILAGLFLLSIFLAKGTNPPFGEVYQFIFASVPYLQVFRNPFEKAAFILSLSTSLLIGFSIFSLSVQFPRKIQNLLYFVSFGLIGFLLGFPFFTGLVFTSSEPPANDYKVGYKVKVPSYYQQADQWLIGQGDNFRFIGFPLGDEGITYNWGKGYSGVELSSALFSTPGILHNTAVPYFHDLVPNIQPALLTEQGFINLANVLNVRYILVRHDVNYEYRKMENPSIIDKVLKEREEKKEVKNISTFGQLSFWENLKWTDKTFYSANKIIATPSAQVLDLLSIDVKEGEVLTSSKDLQGVELGSKVEISYQKINPAKYIVHIKNSSPFVLVFSELFNDVWQASNESNVYKHFRANFYANGWLINSTGESDIIIEYLPQKLLEVGEKVSFFSYLTIVLICCIFLVLKIAKRKIK